VLVDNGKLIARANKPTISGYLNIFAKDARFALSLSLLSIAYFAHTWSAKKSQGEFMVFLPGNGLG
jgi:hypothetical protein